MPRHCSDISLSEEPPKKKNCSYLSSSFNLKSGQTVQDLHGKEWKLGKTVGVGGFGQIYLASDTGDVETDCPYVAKIERHKHGPLFVEINCYLRIARKDLIEEWKSQNKLSSLGLPHYVASGSHTYNNERYRFLILPRYDVDLEKILEEKIRLNLKTVLTIACQIVDILEYIHSKGYIHSDIKASNILLNYENKKQQKKVSLKGPPRTRIRRFQCNPVRACRTKPTPKRIVRNLRPKRQSINYFDDILNFDEIISDNYGNDVFDTFESETDLKSNTSSSNNNKRDQVYLLDYGLACKYLLSNGKHKPFCVDERKAHAGTISFCSRDAHKGVQSRRSDLESLGYNMIYWLTGNLPWVKDSENLELVEKMKFKAFTNLDYFLHLCFSFQYPKFLLEYFQYLQKLQFQDKPDYEFIKTLFKDTIRQYGYKDDCCFDFDNVEGWGQKQKKIKPGRENMKVKRIVYNFSRPPLVSNNIPIRPLLRKKLKNKMKKAKAVHWSQILIDPEIIIKQARRNLEADTNNYGSSITMSELDLYNMNPTAAMLEVYHKCKESGDVSPSSRGDCVVSHIDGYTPAMLAVFQRMKEREEFELEKLPPLRTRGRTARKQRNNKSRTNNNNRVKQQLSQYPIVKLQQLKNEYSAVDQQLRKEKTASKRSYSLRG